MKVYELKVTGFFKGGHFIVAANNPKQAIELAQTDEGGTNFTKSDWKLVEAAKLENVLYQGHKGKVISGYDWCE